VIRERTIRFLADCEFIGTVDTADTDGTARLPVPPRARGATVVFSAVFEVMSEPSGSTRVHTQGPTADPRGVRVGAAVRWKASARPSDVGTESRSHREVVVVAQRMGGSTHRVR
jgi:hypothetical protein